MKYLKKFNESTSVDMQDDYKICIMDILNIARDEGLIVNITNVSEFCTLITVSRYDLGEEGTGPSDYHFDRKRAHLEDKMLLMDDQSKFCDIIENMYERISDITDSVFYNCRYYVDREAFGWDMKSGTPKSANYSLSLIMTKSRCSNMDIFRNVGKYDVINVDFELGYRL